MMFSVSNSNNKIFASSASSLSIFKTFYTKSLGKCEENNNSDKLIDSYACDCVSDDEDDYNHSPCLMPTSKILLPILN